jgi:cell division septal protein FtsQ
MNLFQQWFRERPKRILLIAVLFAVVVMIAALRWQYSRTISRVNVVGTRLIRQSEIVDLVLQSNLQSNGQSNLQSNGQSKTQSSTHNTGQNNLQSKQPRASQELSVKVYTSKISRADINTSEIERRIEKHPFVKRASVFVGASDVLTVEIEERKPIAYLMMKGKQYYVDADAHVLPYRLTETVLDLPVISALGRTKLDSARIADVITTARAVQAFDKEAHQSLYRSLSEIDVLPSGEFQFRLAEYATLIRFGTSEQKEAKIARLGAFLNHCARTKTSLDACKYVDVRWEHQIVIAVLRNGQ